ncbi:hypothetical protein GW643_17240 [Serratia marcescens]|uniref:hypothetical protein n=1 Tax=Serratia marcescens TaxID=615 RepID=UPI001376E04A|nr:hypothetical protein [Serratia marcescens]MBH3035811.1 hypothetical protein [Serratia marcescens]MBH3063802.1 hypothetical protein [Serratia marcescens]NCJ12115.1 hypothetical protein [Serratia marcescens]NDJ04671.1 hypothetical protein [Serratia marcescens]
MSDIQLVRITHVVTEKVLIVSGDVLGSKEKCSVSAFPGASPVVRERGKWQWNIMPNSGELHGFLNTFSNGRLWFGEHDEQADARAAITISNGDGIDTYSIVAEPLGNDTYFLKWNSGQVAWDNYGHIGDGYLFVYPDTGNGESRVFWARKEDHLADIDSFKFQIKPAS